MRYGWRARIGQITPAIFDTAGEEFRKLLPEGVLHVALTIAEPIQFLGEEQAAAAFNLLVDAGRRLAREKVGVIVCGGGPVLLSRGPGGDAQMMELLRRETGLPVVTVNSAVIEALRMFRVRSVVAVSPFVEARNEEIRGYLEASGFRVLATRGLGLVKNIDFAMQSSEAAYTLARETIAANPQAEGIYIACPRWPVVDIIESLESDTGIPVVAAAAVSMWGALRAVRVRDAKPGYGRLMETVRSH